MGGECGTHVGKNVRKSLVEKPKRKRPLERPSVAGRIILK
jgi:hypothetical protein